MSDRTCWVDYHIDGKEKGEMCRERGNRAEMGRGCPERGCLREGEASKGGIGERVNVGGGEGNKSEGRKRCPRKGCAREGEAAKGGDGEEVALL